MCQFNEDMQWLWFEIVTFGLEILIRCDNVKKLNKPMQIVQIELDKAM